MATGGEALVRETGWGRTFADAAEKLAEPAGVAALLIGYALVWAAIGTILNSGTSVHHDMTEAWVWGKEFEPGYAKHPPLMAWITGLWFQVWPRTNWAFELLSGVNAAIGLAGVWAIARRLLEPQKALAVVLLVVLQPFWNLMALKFNANSAQLAIWPWVVWSFMRSLDERGAVGGVVFGVFCGLALLTKYYGAVLLAACFVASLLHPKARAYYTAPAPYLAVIACALTIAPHVWWIATQSASTIAYALDKANHPFWPSAARGVQATLLSLLYLLPAAIGWAYACGRDLRSAAAGMAKAFGRQWLWLTVLTVGPFVLTLLTVFASVRISSQFLIPAFFMLPVEALLIADLETGRKTGGRLLAFATTLTVLVLCAAPVAAALLAFKFPDDRFREPRIEAAREATKLWHATYATPLRIVAGADRYARAVSFYSPDAPSQFIDFNRRFSPWITSDRIAREGMLVVCEPDDAGCRVQAQGYADATRVERTIPIVSWGFTRGERKLDFWLIPPGRSRQ